jgi:GT2 family glycosyltransferase/glycosyltransferase involved in cell wall biosynthesis
LLWVLKSLSRPPILRHAYSAVLVHLIKATGLFDHAFYIDTHGDAVHGDISPLSHYVTCGDWEGRSPMAFFDPDHYRSRARGRTKNVNALLHYALVGRYLRISPSPWFDVDFYMALNKDVARAGYDPLFHYLKWGGFEGRCPSPEFDSAYYMQAYPDVARLRLNPLDHYLRIGRFEGRRTVPDVSQAYMPGRNAWAGLRNRAGIADAAVDVVVPVFNGRAETLRCLHSVLTAACTTSFELVVIDDASPDAELVGDLKGLSSQGLFSLLVNPKNLGFVRTANLGMALHPGRDVVLLNSDTQVFDGWLDRLRQAAHRHLRTATVTPLSNNATICSYPRFLQDNPFPLELSYSELDILTAAVNAGGEVEAPTGVGFCMYIKHTALEEVGPFDEAAFGRGYGEENDFCQRAIRQGWRNIIAADVFVHHWGSASFQGEKAKRVRHALKTMDRLHPNYQKDVARFIECDPLAAVRRRLDHARLQRVSRKKNVLIVCHNRGGGAERHVQEEILRLNQEGYGVFLLRPAAGRPSHAVLRHPAARSLPNLFSVPLADTGAMTAALKELGITEIHTHSLVDFAPDFPDHLVALVKALDARWEVNLHDYKVICPRINLADENGFYCGEPSETTCDRCLAEYGSDFGVKYIRAWRAMHRRALFAADQVLVPDPDVAERLGCYYPEVSFNVSPHQDIDPARIRPRLQSLAADDRLRIVVIGAIGKIKGFDVLLACAQNAKLRRLPLEFILMGYSMNDRRLRQAGVKVTGRYLEENAQDTLEALFPHMAWLPSVWPETYSYTLSIALKAGLPVAAFDIGAIARRLRQRGLGNGLLPLAMAHRPGEINECFIKERHYFLPDAEMTQNRCQSQVLR